MLARLGMVILLAAWVGCKGKSDSMLPNRSETLSNASPRSVESTPAPGNPSGLGQQAGTDQLLKELTQAVRKFSMEQRRVPKNLDELAASGYLDRVPPAPNGKRYAINKNLEVYLSK